MRQVIASVKDIEAVSVSAQCSVIMEGDSEDESEDESEDANEKMNERIDNTDGNRCHVGVEEIINAAYFNPPLYDWNEIDEDVQTTRSTPKNSRIEEIAWTCPSEETESSINKNGDNLEEELHIFSLDKTATTLLDPVKINRYFHKARVLRHLTDPPRPYGILGLHRCLSDYRSDQIWAHEAAFRKTKNLSCLSWEDYPPIASRQNSKSQVCLQCFSMVVCLVSMGMLIASLALNQWHIEKFSINPMAGPGAAVLLRMGALQRSSIVVDHEWFRILTAIPLHSGLIHWFLNGIVLWWMSRHCFKNDDTQYAWRPILVFILAAVGGNLCSALYSPFSISMGASGGLFGWLGYCFVDVVVHIKTLMYRSVDSPFRFSVWMAMCWLSFDVLLLLLLGLTPYVDNFAHMGGFLYGMGVGGSLLPPLIPLRLESCNKSFVRKEPRRIRRYGSLALAIISIVVHVILLAQSDSNYDVCKKCRFFSCVPFPFWTDDKWWYCDACEYCPVQATTDPQTGKSWLEIGCPYGEWITLPFPQLSNDEIIASFVPQTCRTSCAL